jgi:anti-anti-sigma regulatory factor
MWLTQRQVVLALLGLLVGAIVLTIPIQLIGGAELLSLTSTLVGLLAVSGLLAAYWRGWEYARHLTLVLITLLVGLSTVEPYLGQQFTITAFLPPVLALILVGPAWVIGSAAALMLLLASRAGWQGVYADPLNLILYGLSVGGIVLARLVTDNAQRAAEANAKRAEEARLRSEQQAAELSQQASELKHQNEEQRRLIDLVATLEIPAVVLADGVLLAPVVGHLDSRRAGGLTDRLLHEVNSSRARLVILDIAGVPTVDTAVAQALLRAVQAVRLLGCEVTITGISSSIAATMITLGINMAGVHTARTPQEALARSLSGDSPRRN